jgi:hypothetical protein
MLSYMYNAGHVKFEFSKYNLVFILSFCSLFGVYK